jgi:toxin ParE1/3/4
MTTEVRYVPFAINDLEEIFEYIAFESKSERIASGVIRRIQKTAENFSTQPHAGTRCDDLIPDGRRFVVGKYVVYYRPRSFGIEVLQIIHGSRDLSRHVRRPNDPT